MHSSQGFMKTNAYPHIYICACVQGSGVLTRLSCGGKGADSTAGFVCSRGPETTLLRLPLQARIRSAATGVE